jgi:predicted esterase
MNVSGILRGTIVWAAILVSLTWLSADDESRPLPAIPRTLPPVGVELPADVQERLSKRAAELEHACHVMSSQMQIDARRSYAVNDALAMVRAVDMALRGREFYDLKRDVAKAEMLLKQAESRLNDLRASKLVFLPSSGASKAGLTVGGFHSWLDGSLQPYGVVTPKGFEPHGNKKYPLYVWLHGRGDQATNLLFVHERLTQQGQLGDVDAVVLHPFGRHCVGFQGPGEIDVLECIDHFLSRARLERFPIDPERVVLVGFSMGGAGAWHVGAHRTDRFVAIAPGAGFAETARYTKTDPAKVPWYERTLWRYNDAPNYVRNLFNTEVIAYSGENDKQIQAAQVMAEAYEREGRALAHLIGPGVGHQYEPHTLAELKQRLAKACEQPLNPAPRTLTLQTPTLSFSKMHYVVVHGLKRHWTDSRVDVVVNDEKDHRSATITTRNITRLELKRPPFTSCTIDGVPIDFRPQALPQSHFVEKSGDRWELRPQSWHDLYKNRDCHGPIDDAFCGPFLVVLPSGKSSHPLVDRWTRFETDHFLERWRTLMRGEARVKLDREVTPDEIAAYNLVCFGDPVSNTLIGKAMAQLPIKWSDDELVVGEQRFPAEHHVPAVIYPNPLQTPKPDEPRRYIVLNSGLTFREAHDKTNSQQNPKLPDWAVIDLREPPSDKAPGRIAAAGFFNEQWQFDDSVAER